MLRRTFYSSLTCALVATLTIAACDSGDADVVVPGTTLVMASEWIDAANWDEATIVEVSMVETSANEMSFSPNNLSFEAGKPYILRITNAASNSSKHYFSPEGTSFYMAIATRKVQTAEAEYKAPYFDAVELKLGGTLEIYFVPVIAGTYDLICTITNHASYGMTGEVVITGGEGNQLDLEVAADFNTALLTDDRRSGGHDVWTNAIETTVAMSESGNSYSFVPPDLALTAGVGYRLLLDNPSDNAEKHYYTAPDFYQTVVPRKADDDHAEIKVPYFRAVELLIGGSTTLFIVPTVAGTYEVLCTIPGHAEAGMTGTITVGTSP